MVICSIKADYRLPQATNSLFGAVIHGRNLLCMILRAVVCSGSQDPDINGVIYPTSSMVSGWCGYYIGDVSARSRLGE